MSIKELQPQLTQLMDTAVSITSRLSHVLKATDKTALDSSMNSILPMAERLERLMRATPVNEFNDVSLELEISAINLWNAVTISMKSESKDIMKTLCLIKFFSSILCSIHDIIDCNSLRVKFRAMTCFIKSLKSAIDEDDINLAMKIQEYADRQFKSIEAVIPSLKDIAATREFQKFKTDLFIMKMQLSIVENDVSMAKLYEERAEIERVVDNHLLVSETLRVIYNSSLMLYEKKQFEDASYFLQKIVDNYNLHNLPDSKDVKVSIYSLLVQCSIEIKSEKSFKAAKKAINELQDIDPESLDYFKLDINLKKLQGFSASDIEDSIIRMLMSLKVGTYFREVLSIINEHYTSDPLSAIKCYEYAFTNSLDPLTDQDSLEMVLIAMINSYTRNKFTPSDIRQPNLLRFLDISEKIFVKNISKRTSSTCVTLLWTAGKSESKENQNRDAIGWYKIALHRVIQINQIDKGKVQRALQNCYIIQDELQNAVSIFESMDEKEKNNLITQYNMFKVYASKADEDKLRGCFHAIVDSEDKLVIPLLSLCAISTESNSRIAIESMMALFKKLDKTVNSKVNIPAAVKCVIELIFKEGGDDYPSQYLETLIILFDETYSFAKESIHIPNYRLTFKELKWFSSQSFNLARSCLLNDDYTNGELFAEISIKIGRLIPDDVSFKETFEVQLWGYRAKLINIMCTSKLLNISHDSLWGSIRTQSLNLRISIDEFIIIYKNKSEFSEFEKDWEKCLLDAMIFQFQSELELGNWSAAETVVIEAQNFKNVDFSGTVINIVTEGSFPNRVKISTITIIVQQYITVREIDGVLLSRWIRLMLNFPTATDDSSTKCLYVLEKLALRISAQQDNQIPVHEIEWISANCWNTGINLTFSQDKSNGKLWCSMAMKLARFVNERFEITLNTLWDELSTS